MGFQQYRFIGYAPRCCCYTPYVAAIMFNTMPNAAIYHLTILPSNNTGFIDAKWWGGLCIGPLPLLLLLVMMVMMLVAVLLLHLLHLRSCCSAFPWWCFCCFCCWVDDYGAWWCWRRSRCFQTVISLVAVTTIHGVRHGDGFVAFIRHRR